MRKKVIGLIPLYDDEKESYWMLPGYMTAVEACGGLPIMFPMTSDEDELDQLYEMCDGILFTGGHDVDPEIYGQRPTDKCGKPCKARDIMEKYLLEKAIIDDKPVLGICRGIQFMNAVLGGTLYQDLPSEYESNTEHHMSPPYDETIHGVDVLNDTKLANIIGAGLHQVNSYHHQAVKELSDKCNVEAISEDGLIEAISVKDKKFAIGVQWHPEFAYKKKDDCKQIVQAFIDAC